MADYQAQIVVIAGGPSGLSAAVQAAQDGADVILIEKNNVVGGAANMGMGPLAIESHIQKRQMIDLTIEQAYRMIMEYTHYNIDGRLVKRYFEQSAGTIEWLEEMGVEFEGAYPYFTKSAPTWHIVKKGDGIGPRSASKMNLALYAQAQELGVRFLMETYGTKILKDEEGKVCGVLAVDKKTGKEIEIECKAAVICTGGGGDNPAFIKEFTGYTFGEDMFNFAIPGNKGDGIKMAWEAGVDKMPIRIEQAATIEGMDELPQSVPNIMLQPNLLVNLHGKRVMDEEQMQNTTFLSNAASHQKGKVLFSIVDTSIVKYYIRNGIDEICMVRMDEDVSDFMDGVEMAQQTGKGLYMADTIEELAEKLGIDPDTLSETVEDYNTYCDSYDEEFFKRRKYLRPLRKGPFYAAAIRPGGYGTVGGIRINENCECLDSEFEPIPGLYAAGADACNIYDDSYMFLLPGNSMGFAVNTGRIAGMEAAEYVED